MTFSTAHFRTAASDSLGDTAIAYTLTTARWGVLAYDAVTSDRAIAAYRKGWQFARGTALFFIGLGILSRRVVQNWVDATVDEAMTKDHYPDAGNMVDPFDPSVNPLPDPQPATISAPIAVARVEVAAPAAMPPIRELRKLAKGGVVKGASRMSQRKLFEALRELGKV